MHPELDPETTVLERERELTELTQGLDRAKTGSGSALSIEADAGLGKTTLLQEVRRAGVADEFTVLSARATELERDFPFALVRQLFAIQLAALPEIERAALLEGAGAAAGALGLGPEIDSTHDSFAVLHALYWVTAGLAERTPLLLAIDDAHWADSGSLSFLSFLLPRLQELPICLVIANRPNEPDAAEALRPLLDDPTMSRLSPRPLSLEATTAFLRDELGRDPQSEFARACHEASGGNPFLLRELARALAERGVDPIDREQAVAGELAPARVGRLVDGRLSRFSPEASRIAAAVAVLGENQDLALVAELAEIETDAARRAADELRSGSILEKAESLRFAHPLVRNAVYSQLGIGERSRAHAEAAALLRNRGASPEEISTQLLAAEPRGSRDVVETLIAAADRSLADGAPRSTIAYLTRAMREPPPADLRPAVLEPLIDACFRAVDHSAWAEVEPEINSELERDPGLRTKWAVLITRVLAMHGRFEDAIALLVDAARIAAEEGDIEMAFQLEAQLGTLAMIVPSAPKVDLSGYAERIDPHSPAGRLAASIEARRAFAELDRERAIAAAEHALGEDCVIFEEDPELMASVLAIGILLIADEVDGARHAAMRALEIARRRNTTPEVSRGFFLRGMIAGATGDLLDAEADLRQAADIARLAAVPPMILAVASTLTEVLIERDDLPGAEAELAAIGMASGPMPENMMFGFTLVARCHLRAERGEANAALDDFLALTRLEERYDIGTPSAFVLPSVVQTLFAVGEEKQAIELADALLLGVRRWGAPSSLAFVLWGYALTRNGPERINALEEAITVAKGAPRRLVHAQVLLAFGETLRRGGRRKEARQPLREAFELARRRGGVRVAKRAHEELEATGEKMRQYAPSGPESLTPSERRVAGLAAGGMTNRQIAQTLFVTVKTVESHLRSAYMKLDIDSRAQLPDALAR